MRKTYAVGVALACVLALTSALTGAPSQAADRAAAPAGPTAARSATPAPAPLDLRGQLVDDTVPPGAVPGVPAYSARLGVPRHVRVLVLRMYWSGKAPKHPDTGEMRTLMKQTSSWFAKTSRGRHHLSSKVTPWLKVGGGSSNCGSRAAVGRALAAARGRGIGSGGFNRFMLVMPQCGTNSLGEMPGRVTWIMEQNPTLNILVHELGHNLGLNHANSLICQKGKFRVTQAGTCYTQEYGDMWDAMGLSDRQYSVGILKRLGWAGRTATASKDGTWTLTDAEKSGSGLQGLRVRSGGATYWLEYRTNPVALEQGNFTLEGSTGIQVRLDSGRSMRILDTLPNSPNTSGLVFPDPDLVSATLPSGSSFTTPQRVRITVVSQTATTATVRVTRGKKATAPAAPTLLSVLRSQSGSMIRMKVKPPESDGGQIVLGYQATRSPGNKSFFVPAPGGAVDAGGFIDLYEYFSGGGSWTLRAVNQVGTSPASNKVDDALASPSVTITSPVAGTQVYAGTQLAVTATATPDPASGADIDYVQVCLSGGGCQTDQSAPWQFSLETFDPGSQQLVATAYDELSGKGTSAPVPITVVATPPSVQITSPASGATVSAVDPFVVQVAATPNPVTHAAIFEVTYEVYTSPGGQFVTSDFASAAPFSGELWLGSAGGYEIRAVATDANGFTSGVSSILVTAVE